MSTLNFMGGSLGKLKPLNPKLYVVVAEHNMFWVLQAGVYASSVGVSSAPLSVNVTLCSCWGPIVGDQC